MAADSAAIKGPPKSTFFHQEHLLSRYHYSEASTHSCAACELTVTGAGYSCDECAFNIHEACLSLPLLVDSDGHPGHELTLTRLAGASRWCDAGRETSGAGRYMYLCAACNYDVHPCCPAG
ncbi:protein VACUOLELESS GAMETOPHYTES-like [Miscanthus floridulus]|uniref:protein VACUOLELESS GAMETOPHYTES-like n=1 Tax=Miscanthus floridulus TaxID=154761 RepID=UPI00345AD2E9